MIKINYIKYILSIFIILIYDHNLYLLRITQLEPRKPININQSYQDYTRSILQSLILYFYSLT